MIEKKEELTNDFLQLARIALSGRQQDVQLLIHRASKRLKDLYPELTEKLIALLKESPTRNAPLRKHADTPLPVDLDSRLQLLRLERALPDHQLVLPEDTQAVLNQIISERKATQALLKHGLLPTKSMLFTGPPGVGKTMAAKWVAQQLNRPLLVLDLSAVMSSFLGRTGNNIRFVLDYAKNTECVLLIDELDAIAKRRDDNSEIGELKRLVTVLLQEIDDWPASGLLIAATNHPDLLDPAIWRRFESVLHFSIPALDQIESLGNELLRSHIKDHSIWAKILAYAFAGKSHSEFERQINMARRSAAINNLPLEEKLKEIVSSANNLNKDQRKELAVSLSESGILSQRQITELTGVARDTIRKHTKKQE
jgi:SpoVK/Ycf46/Vps4 family AAA+-type ATPase